MMRYALVPQHFTPEMAEAAREAICREIQSCVVDPEAHAVAAYHAAIAASPGQGAVTAAQLEAVAKVIDPGAWRGSDDMSLNFRRRAKEKAARCLEAIGLTVQP